MNIKSLSNNMLRPKCLDNLKYNSNDVFSSFMIEPLTKDIDCNIRVNFHGSINKSDILKIINYFDTFDYLKLIDWDDDVSFDFDRIYELSILFKISNSFIKSFLKYFNINTENTNNIIDSMSIKHLMNKYFYENIKDKV